MKYGICVIGDKTKGVQGNCPLCFGTLLYLSELNIPYRIEKFLDEEDPWMKEISNGDAKMPFLHIIAEDIYIVGEEAIMEYMRKHEPAAQVMGNPDGDISPKINIGTLAPDLSHDELYKNLQAILKIGDFHVSKETEAWIPLMHILMNFNSYLKDHGQPFIGGSRPNANDCYLVAQLMHCYVALKNFRRWDMLIDPKLPEVISYVNRWKSRESWQTSQYDEDLVKRHFEKELANKGITSKAWQVAKDAAETVGNVTQKMVGNA